MATSEAFSEALHTVQLPRFSAKESSSVSVKEIQQSPKEITQEWITRLENVLKAGKVSALTDVIHPEGWWRDHLALSWDLRTLRGLDTITAFLTSKLDKLEFKDLTLQESGQFVPCKTVPVEGLEWIESMFSFKTAIGSGNGVFRLVQTENGVWKAHMIYTVLQELDGVQESVGEHRPHGGNNSLIGGAISGNWCERRERKREFLDEEPDVLVLGAGQSGLNIGARLQSLGLSAVIVDKNERVGDNWRQRYRTLVTHDPVQYCHMAYMPFPTNWPLFTPKDKLADWFEYYAGAMELNVWLKSTVKSAVFDDATGTWTIEVVRGDDKPDRILKPKHIVFATGQAGEPLVPSFSGQDTFQGVVYHGSQHKDASHMGDVAGKKVVVVGTGNSGHDIAQNYYENGASVQMLQRRGTYVISAKTGLVMLNEGMYDENGPPTEEADVYSQSLPIPIQFALDVAMTQKIKAAEMVELAGLEKAGFKLDYGEDGSGISRKYLTRGGGYYIDVGASQLIIDGKIKVVQSPNGIKCFEADGLVLVDGRKLEADIVVLATGFDNMRTSVRKILGDKISDRCKDVWDLDAEGEINAVS
jgi:cation diffusion facilitator CzcD-associated flavoprotein CzcO